MMQAAAVDDPVSRVEAEVLRIRALLEKSQFAQALAAAQALLTQVPQNRDVWYMIAVSQRYLRLIPEALETLAHFEAIHPEYSRLFQERAHCLRAIGDAPGAIAAYLRAVNINPALPASWNALQQLYIAVGDSANSQTAASHVAKLASLPVPIVNATSLFADGEIHAAEQVVRQFLQTHGDHIEGMRLLAQIGIKLEVLDDAEFLLESVLVFAPDYHLARYDYARVLSLRHQHAKAVEEARKLLAIEPQHRGYRTIYATASVGVGDFVTALRVFRELAAETPQAADIHLSIAHTLKTLGKQQDAIESYRAAAAAAPSLGDAYWSLANLKTYRFTDDEIVRMRTQEAAPSTTLVDRYHLCFALGKALEDAAQYAESFRYYESGNALKKSESRYQPGPIERNARLQAAVCTAEFFAARQGVGCDRPDPIFIVGLPRSGSTLIEQILASHSQVEGTMELADIPRLVQQLQGRNQDESKPRYPGVLAELNSDQFKRFGEKYLADTQVYRTGKPFFIDKMPNNFRHLGLIRLMLPNARIIDARREPLACCFSNFKQLFATGQEFTYSLEDVARYYGSYIELMQHWERVLPGKVLRVQHEDVVENLEGNVRRILDFCGLDYERQCVEFYKTERSVRTASSEQVRQPIFKDGLDQWRNFEPFLGPLKAALGPLAAS
jgi:tetratricopeptide (TPR) repeat protein